MKLVELLRQCFDPSEFQMFLVGELDQGREVWNATKEDSWNNRSFQLVEKLRRDKLVDRHLFEALIRARPKRADEIAAACRHETQQPLNYAIGDPPTEAQFPWGGYQAAMEPGAERLLKYAAYDARSRGHKTISTSEIFRVYRALQPWIAAVFPEGRKIKQALLDGDDDFGSLGASYCVSKTIHGLATNIERPHKFSEHDVFLDLARFGAGESASGFVPDGATLEQINEVSRMLGVGRVTRHGVLDEPTTTDYSN